MRAQIYIPASALNRWAEDQEAANDYYNSPAGAQHLPLASVAKGFPREVLLVAASGDTYIPCGYSERGGVAVWLRSSGSWAAAYQDRGILEVSGPRHSIRELIPDYLRDAATDWRYISTREPHWAPWETRDDQHAQDAMNRVNEHWNK